MALQRRPAPRSLRKVKLSETREPPLKRRVEEADFRGAICLGNMSYRKVSLHHRF